MQFVTTSIPVQAAEKVMTMTSSISAAWLLRHLEYSGIRLEVHGKNIRISPVNKLTDAYRKAIKEQKRELMALVRDRVPPSSRCLVTGKQPAKVEPFVCPICEQPRPGDPDCPRCKLERDWVDRKPLPASGVDLAPGNLRTDDPGLPEQVLMPVFPQRPDDMW